MAGGEDEAVAVGPVRVARVVLHDLARRAGRRRGPSPSACRGGRCWPSAPRPSTACGWCRCRAGGLPSCVGRHAWRMPRHDRRHPYARRADSRACRTSRSSRTSARSTACASPTSTRATGRRSSSGTASRRGRSSGARSSRPCATPASAASRPTCRASGARTSRPTSAGTPTTATPSCVRVAVRRRSTCATRRSSSTTGAGRSGCASPSSSPTASTGIVILDTGLFTGHQRMSDAWIAFRDFVERTEDLPIGFLVDGACATRPAPTRSIAAYDAPFPNAGVEGRRARLPADAPDDARRARAPRRASGCSTRCATTSGRC